MTTDDPEREGIRPQVILDEAHAFADTPGALRRQGAKVPPWVTDLAKWGSLSRAERRKMERYHRRLNGGR